MEMTGEQRIPAPRAKVWAALNNPDILKQSIPGCDDMQKISDTEFHARVTLRVGPVKASFLGKVTLSDIDPPNSYTLTGEGQGGVAGFGKGGARVTLQDDGEGTLLRYTSSAQVGGKLAQIGSRLIDAAARKMADDFFSRFNQVVAAEVAAPAAVATPPPAPAVRPAGVPPLVWIAILTALVAALLLWLLL
jgi:carbon monoxide dehydrogenase subunit G